MDLQHFSELMRKQIQDQQVKDSALVYLMYKQPNMKITLTKDELEKIPIYTFSYVISEDNKSVDIWLVEYKGDIPPIGTDIAVNKEERI